MSPNYAYITILSTEDYLDGVGALMLSLEKTQTRIPFYVLCGPGISNEKLACLEKKGNARILHYDTPVTVPEDIQKANLKQNNSNWNHTFDKLLVFELTQFEKIVFIDADMMVMQNLDHLFEKPHMSATNAGYSYPGNEKDVDLNSGLMVIEPQAGIINSLLSTIPSILKRKTAFGDQDLLQEYCTEWRYNPQLNLGEKYNVYANYLAYYIKKLGYHFNSDVQDPKSIAVVHFIGASKPWHAHWNWLSKAYKELCFWFLDCFGIHKAQWALLRYKHLIMSFRRHYK